MSPTAPVPSETPPTAPCICGRLRRATRALTRLYDEALETADLTVTQFTVLRTLSSLKAPTLTELSDATGHERSGLWRTLQPLVRSGVVTSARVPGLPGARLQLTDLGRERLDRAQPGWSEAQARVTRLLGPRRNQLIALLSEIETLV